MDPIVIISNLLRAAIDGRMASVPSGLPHDDWDLILGICAAQKVHTFVYDALPEDGVPGDVRIIWRSQVETNERAAKLVDAIVAAQEEAWKKRGLDYALLKGPAVAALYPVPEHRHCGDIDWWFGDKRSWDAALELASRNAENGVHVDSDGDINYLFKGVVIEHHRDWTHLASRRLRKLAGTPEIVNGRLGPEDTLLSLMCHILHHVAWEGANLKQLADLAVALRYYEGQYDKQHFDERLHLLSLSNWAALLKSICCYGDSPALENDRRRLMSVILESEPGFLSRLRLMWKASPRECVARYCHLVTGRLSRTR